MKITVETTDLVTITEIAKRLDIGRSVVSMWAHRHETNGFPAPVLETASVRLWSWKDVAFWVNTPSAA